MEVDEALGQLGIGRWQILHFTIFGIAGYTMSCFHMLAIIYIGRPKCYSLHDATYMMSSENKFVM